MALILVFEAEPVVATVCSAILESAGFSVYVTGSIERAFDFFGRRNSAVEAVVADASTARSGGAELARRIFRLHSGAAVVLTTTWLQIPQDLRARCAILEKPFTARELLASLRASVARRALPQPCCPQPFVGSMMADMDPFERGSR